MTPEEKKVLLKFSALVKLKRVSRKMTQHQLSGVTGRHLNFIQRVEKGRLNPSFTNALILCRVLNISLDEFIGTKRMTNHLEKELLYPIEEQIKVLFEMVEDLSKARGGG